MIRGDSHVFFLVPHQASARDLWLATSWPQLCPAVRCQLAFHRDWDSFKMLPPAGDQYCLSLTTGQKKKKLRSHFHPLGTTLHKHTFFLLLAHGFHHPSVLSLLSSNFTYLSWHDEATSREFQTCFRQRHQNIWRENMKSFRLPLSLLFDL